VVGAAAMVVVVITFNTMFVNCICILLMYSVQAIVLMPLNVWVFNISEKFESGNLNAVGMGTESQ
jgi:hypothetical protein